MDDLFDPVKYIPKYFKIVTKADLLGHSELIPMELWPPQRDYIEKRTNRDVVLKYRQLGMSTGIEAANTHKLFTRPYQRMSIITHDTETSEFLLQNVQRFHDYLPEEMKPTMAWKSAGRKTFPGLDAYIFVESAKSDAIGIGHTLNIAHLSEVSRWPDKRARDLFAGISQTVPMGGFITVESTPKGRNGLFYELYQAAKRGESPYKPFFYQWWWAPDYMIPDPPDGVIDVGNNEKADAVARILGISVPDLIAEEQTLMLEHNLSPNQIAWRRIKITEIRDLFFQEYPESDIECLLPGSMVVLGDGSRRTVQSLVNEKYEGEVLSVDKDNNIVKRRVIGWHSSHRRDRKLYKLSYAYNRKAWTKNHTGITLTEDHEVLTQRGWIKAASLRDGENVSTGTPFPGYRTEQMILGTILGEATLARRKLSFSHSKHQWSSMKHNLLEGFSPAKYLEPTHNSLFVTTKACPYFEYLRECFYTDGIKRVNRELVSRLDDFGIAVWFQDDGSTRIRRTGRPLSEIATGVLPREDVEFLCDLLNSKGYECKPLVHNRKYLKVQFSADGTGRLLANIGKYIVPEMRYKLGDGCEDFQLKWYHPEPVTSFWSPVEIKETPIVLQKGRWEKFSKLYCIDVEETHNFVTIGGTVHNCWLSNELSVIEGTSLRPYYPRVRDGRKEGPVTIWKDKVGGRKYVMGVDTASGTARDYSVASVLDCRTLEYVARVRGKLHTDLFAEEVYELGMRYNRALVAVERDKYGYAVLKTLLHKNYPNLFYHVDFDETVRDTVSDVGWKTTSKTKPMMVAGMIAGFRSQDLVSWSENLLDETASLTWEGDIHSKIKTPYNGNDDEFIAVSIALQVREQEPINDDDIYSPAESYARIF